VGAKVAKAFSIKLQQALQYISEKPLMYPATGKRKTVRRLRGK